jgi:hypothetical protein
MHPPDLAVWPNSNARLGFGLWRSLPSGWWFVELAVIGALWAYYWRRSRRHESFGGRPVATAMVLLGLHAFNSPWLSRFQVTESHTAASANSVDDDLPDALSGAKATCFSFPWTRGVTRCDRLVGVSGLSLQLADLAARSHELDALTLFYFGSAGAL